MSIDIETLDTGTAYACLFKNELDQTRVGVLERRDREQRLVSLIDAETGMKYVRSFEEIWDVDVAVPATEES